MVKRIPIGLALLTTVVLIFAANRPDTFRVQRSLDIQAPPQQIFPFINDLGLWRPKINISCPHPLLRRMYELR